ncbi:putative lipoprotein [Listeria weihenstephanensis FSL R9-0317]|uniref:Lipoprotein n=1 Tax=Listeria weihenstephanensis TaxID=1006155 RepID=A0A1S7FX46_9LIST|nr:hypothetical protein [Listeria weihenstephanensis]AQY52011.1 hypothetical protein UE46_13900 [Listeria weihenstephanensis]EUJ40196.1 putative lipoprotein [Listeria weihenstephanensis FSL R9-0317]MBC1501629.1 hypothetical protein [Listeria weihenstephanensis]
MNRIMKLCYLLISLFLVGCTNDNANEVTKETKIGGSLSADYNIPESIGDIEEISEDILETQVIRNISIGEYDGNNGDIPSTITELEVLQNYKGSFKKGDRIRVAEPYYLKDGALEFIENYVPLQQNENYTVFLRGGHESDGISSIISMGFGKYREELTEKQAEVTDFETLGELGKFDFISPEIEQVGDYKSLKEEVFQEYE